MTRIDQSQSVTGDVTTTDTAIVSGGQFASHFNSYKSNSCPDDDSNCNPESAESYQWNGKAFVVSNYEAKHKEFLRKLAAQRECVKKKYDPKTGTTGCDTPYDCENYNDLAFLALESGDTLRARSNAELALSACNQTKEGEIYILKTPKLADGGIGALSEAAMPSASAARVSTGSITPSSHSRALE